jgi:hypothetical protein
LILALNIGSNFNILAGMIYLQTVLPGSKFELWLQQFSLKIWEENNCVTTDIG